MIQRARRRIETALALGLFLAAGSLAATAADYRPATHRVFGSRTYPSHVRLMVPVRKAALPANTVEDRSREKKG